MIDHVSSDQKRLVRGENLLLARNILRIRDGVHHKKWNILTTIGPSPNGEITAIREIMPKAFIVGIDSDKQCCDAIEVGVAKSGFNQIVGMELGEFCNTIGECNCLLHKNSQKHFNVDKGGRFRCDHINLDLCTNSLTEIRRLKNAVERITSPGSPISITFSFGRDVVEIPKARLSRVPDAWREKAEEAGIGVLLLSRVVFILGASADFTWSNQFRGTFVKHIFAYRGNNMPMCSVTFIRGRALSTMIPHEHTGMTKIGSGDFEIAATCPEPSLLYDCPEKRIKELRRKHAAIKAHYTRKEKEA